MCNKCNGLLLIKYDHINKIEYLSCFSCGNVQFIDSIVEDLIAESQNAEYLFICSVCGEEYFSKYKNQNTCNEESCKTKKKSLKSQRYRLKNRKKYNDYLREYMRTNVYNKKEVVIENIS